MKKIITYIITTSLITSFTLTKPSFANEIQLKNENIIKLNLGQKNIFNLDSNKTFFLKAVENQTELKNNNFNPFFLNFLIPGFTQLYYGNTIKGLLFLLGTILTLILPPILMNIYREQELGALMFSYIWILTPIIYVWSLIDAGYMVANKSNFNQLSLKNENSFNFSLFNKNF